MSFIKRHRILCVFCSIMIICAIVFTMVILGFFSPPITADYQIGSNSVEYYSETPHYYFITVYKDGDSETINLDKEIADNISSIVQSIEGQKISLFTSRDRKESIFIAWGKMKFYPNCYSNSKINYTCDNYQQLYAKLKDIVGSLKE